MRGHIVYTAYYGTLKAYKQGFATKFYTSLTNNVKDVQVLNEPILDWELNSAGNITFTLPPYNAGYDVIECKKRHIFIERNGKLIWHGRAINDTFDIHKNREILCEGALNYLLDTNLKPELMYEVFTTSGNSATDRFNELIDEHNRSLKAGYSLITARTSSVGGASELIGGNWMRVDPLNQYGKIYMRVNRIRFEATANDYHHISLFSNPSYWQYKYHKGNYVRVSFNVELTNAGGSARINYGLHLQETSSAAESSVLTSVDTAVYESGEVEYVFYLGAGSPIMALDGANYPDSYIFFHIHFYGKSGDKAVIKNIKVERVYNFYGDDQDKEFSPYDGIRTGLLRHPEAKAKPVWYYRIYDNQDYFSSTLDNIKKYYTEPYGGYLYIGYDSNSNPILNYIYGDPEIDGAGENLPVIRSKENLISCKFTRNYENIPTVLRPIGAAYDSNPESDMYGPPVNDPSDHVTLQNYIGDRTDPLAGTTYYPIGDINNIYQYGWIEKVVEFEDALDQRSLLATTKHYAALFAEITKTYEIEATDITPISDDSENRLLGMPGSYAKVDIPEMDIDTILCVVKVSLNLRDFSKSTYSLANFPGPDLTDFVGKGTHTASYYGS